MAGSEMDSTLGLGSGEFGMFLRTRVRVRVNLVRVTAMIMDHIPSHNHDPPLHEGWGPHSGSFNS